jgi:hypothetical protein
LSTYGKVLSTDLPLLVLVLKVVELSSQSFLIIQKTNGHVQTSQDAFSVSFELRRVDIGSVDAGEQATSIRVILEETLTQREGKLFQFQLLRIICR